MIRAQELRIGNYILRKDLADNHDRIEQILAIGEKATTTGPIKVICDYNDLDPIPLTEEWLLKTGFIKFSSTQYDRDDFWCLQYIEKKDHAYYNQFWCNQLEIYIQYVHQLQNLYFCLTGEELNIKYENKR